MRPITMKSLREVINATGKPATMTPKDWSALIISIMALVVSALTAYWNIIRQVDDFRVVVTGSPSLIYDKVSQGVEFNLTNGSVTFLNLGNRSAAVTTVYLNLSRGEHFAEARCTDNPQRDDERNYLLRAAAVVVEPGKMSVQPVIYAGSPAPLMYSVKAENASLLPFVVCMTFNVITPDNFAIEKKVFVSRYDVNTNPTDLDRNRLNWLHGDPHILFQKRSFASLF